MTPQPQGARTEADCERLTIEMHNPEAVILEEIASGFSQWSVALTYCFIMRQQGDAADYAKIHLAIRSRWKSKTAVDRIKKQAWRFLEGKDLDDTTGGRRRM